MKSAFRVCKNCNKDTDAMDLYESTHQDLQPFPFFLPSMERIGMDRLIESCTVHTCVQHLKCTSHYNQVFLLYATSCDPYQNLHIYLVRVNQNKPLHASARIQKVLSEGVKL